MPTAMTDPLAANFATIFPFPSPLSTALCGTKAPAATRLAVTSCPTKADFPANSGEIHSLRKSGISTTIGTNITAVRTRSVHTLPTYSFRISSSDVIALVRGNSTHPLSSAIRCTREPMFCGTVRYATAPVLTRKPNSSESV